MSTSIQRSLEQINKTCLSMGVRASLYLAAELGRRGYSVALLSDPDVVRTIVNAMWEGHPGWNESLVGVVAEMLERKGP